MKIHDWGKSMRAVKILCILLSCLFSVRAFSSDVATLVEQLRKGETDSIRRSAARELRNKKYAGNQVAIKALQETLYYEQDKRTREAIAEGLIKIGGDEGFKTVHQNAMDLNSPARIQALDALDASDRDEEVAKVFLYALNDPDEDIRLWAARGLDSRSNVEGVFPVLANYLNGKDDSLVQEYVARGIEYSKREDAAGVLIAALNNKNAGGRRYAAVSLGSLNDPKSVQPLIAASKETDEGSWRLVANAIRSLSSIAAEGNAEAVTRLLEVYNQPDADRLNKEYALRGILRSKDERGREAALSVIKQEDLGYLTTYATELLHKNGTLEDAAALAVLLQAPEGYYRRAAYQAMMAILERNLDPEGLKTALKCFPQTQQRPFSDDTKSVAAMLDIFMLGFGMYSMAAAEGRVTEVDQLKPEDVITLQEALKALPQKPKSDLADSNLNP